MTTDLEFNVYWTHQPRYKRDRVIELDTQEVIQECHEDSGHQQPGEAVWAYHKTSVYRSNVFPSEIV